MSESSGSQDLSGPTLVVDSWPVLEWLRKREPAHSLFAEILEAASARELHLEMSRINYGEVFYNIVHRWGLEHAESYRGKVMALPITLISVDDALIDEAVALKSIYPIAYADAFAAALAIRTDAPVVTGYPDFRKLAGLGVVKLRWLGA
jgi:predicted nucleic acid-binding protein